ncbi:hypothetical protein V2K27_13020 [Pseudomonas alliivorans]|nr:hypothetical protein [Pseudomonas alliivorans]MEE4904929.1 hypothetical protein [Pseudomonas alliivorans]
MIFPEIANALARTIVHLETEETNTTVSEKFRISQFSIDPVFLAGSLNSVHVRDSFSVQFTYAGSDQSLVLTNRQDDQLNRFCQMLHLHVEGDDAISGVLTISITKGFLLQTASIYSLHHIEEYWRSGGLGQAAAKLRSLAQIAYILESSAISGYARCGLFVFRPTSDLHTNTTHPEYADKSRFLAARDKVCLFYDSKSYPFIPQDFEFSTPLPHPGISNLFNTLKLAFAIIFIADVSSLSEQELTATVKGYRHITSSIKLAGTSDAQIAATYYEIYLWAYSEGGVTDKLGIAKNLLSIHIEKSDFRDLRSGTLQAMVSNHSIYLKENVKQYIDIKNKLSEHIQKQSEKASDMVKTIGSYLRASIFTVYSFIVTTFIIRSMSKTASEGTFTTGIYYIFLMFLLLSLSTLFYAYRESEAELDRFKAIYKSFKTRYDDLLSNSDRDRILQNDTDFKRDCEYIKKSSRRAFVLWISTLGAVFAFVSLVKLLNY